MANCCNVCEQPRSKFLMRNKPVCMMCDELLFDIEIECDEEPQYLQPTQPSIVTINPHTGTVTTRKS